MKIINLGETDSLLSHYLAQVRDKQVQKDSLRFRRNLERIGEIFAYVEKADLPCIFAIDEFQQIDRYPEKNVEALLRDLLPLL